MLYAVSLKSFFLQVFNIIRILLNEFLISEGKNESTTLKNSVAVVGAEWTT